jgi:hypothetical protein
MDKRSPHDANKPGPTIIKSETTQESTLLPMLIGGLALIVIGMFFVMWLA